MSLSDLFVLERHILKSFSPIWSVFISSDYFLIAFPKYDLNFCSRLSYLIITLGIALWILDCCDSFFKSFFSLFISPFSYGISFSEKDTKFNCISISPNFILELLALKFSYFS